MNKLAKELLKKNNNREKAIFDENKEIYTNMIVYLRGSDLSEYNQEVVRGDTIELIIDGQQRGDNIKKVMGGRYKEICDQIIEAMPKKTKKDKVMDFLDMSLHALWVLGVISLAKNFIISLISNKAGFEFILTVGDIINGLAIILIANVIVLYITKTAFGAKKEKKVVSFLKAWFIAAAVLAAMILSNVYFRTIAVNISLWLAAITVILIFVIWKIISERA